MRNILIELPLKGVEHPSKECSDGCIVRCVDLRNWASAAHVADVLGYTQIRPRRPDYAVRPIPALYTKSEKSGMLHRFRNMGGVSFLIVSIDLDIFSGNPNSLSITNDRVCESQMRRRFRSLITSIPRNHWSLSPPVSWYFIFNWLIAALADPSRSFR